MAWKKEKIGNFLKRRKDAIEIKNSVEYKRITIRTKHQGILIRNTSKGSLIGTKLQFTVQKGQFLLSKIDARLGAFGIVPEFLDGGIITGNFWAFDVDKKKVNIDWFNLFTSSGNFYEICNQASSGTTHRKYLDETKFLNFEIDLPELDDQNAFIKKYEIYNKNFKSLDLEIENQQTRLQQLRQAILQESVQGKLTKHNKVDEPADKLLKRIKDEKQKLIAAGKLKKEKELPPITEDEIPFELPKGWVWCRLGEVGITQTGATPPTNNKEYFGDYIPFIGPGDMNGGKMNYTNNGLSKAGIEKARLIAKNSILMVCIGGSIGKALINEREITCNQQINTITSLGNIPINYLFFALVSPYFQNEVLSKSIGSATPIINKSKWESIPIPVPPLSEQQRLVAKVHQLLQTVNQLEQQVAQSQVQANKLLQVVLKEAFTSKGKVFEANEAITMAAED